VAFGSAAVLPTAAAAARRGGRLSQLSALPRGPHWRRLAKALAENDGYAAKTVFLSAFCTKNASFYQDRLGTNIGKTRQADRFLRSEDGA
jgi:hypothetical protein